MNTEKNRIPLKKTGTIPVGSLGDGYHSDKFEDTKHSKHSKNTKDTKDEHPIIVGDDMVFCED
jgi:hypothetical protein